MPSTPSSSSVLPRAVELVRAHSLPQALDELGAMSTFELRAAYASAIRRRSEGSGYAAASELLEVALLARRRKVLRGARWYDRPEVFGPMWLGLYALWWGARFSRSGWMAAAGAFLAVATLFALGWWWVTRRRKAGLMPTPSIAEHGRSDLQRLSATVASVLHLAEEGDAVTADDYAEAAQRGARGIGADIVAAAALAHAERALRNSLVPNHRRAGFTVAEARRYALEHQLDPGLRALLR